jgi:hypothetical protein
VGLKHSKLPSGMILTKQSAIDEYIEKYEVKESQIDKIVDEVIKDLYK